MLDTRVSFGYYVAAVECDPSKIAIRKLSGKPEHYLFRIAFEKGFL